MKKRHLRRAPHIAALRRAIEIAGTQSELGRRIASFSGDLSTVRQQTVWYWLNTGILIDPKYWAAIEAATDQQVTRRDLRPDVFGDGDRAS